jgi:hypothetical protein
MMTHKLNLKTALLTVFSAMTLATENIHAGDPIFPADHVVVVNAIAFVPADRTDSLVTGYGGAYGVSEDSSMGEFRAPVQLPDGATVLGLEISVSRQEGTIANISISLEQFCEEEMPCFGPSGWPTISATGYGFRRAFVGQSLQGDVDNRRKTYYVVAHFLYGSAPPPAGVSLIAARVYYRLNVTPAPETPTFSDVPPSHPYYRFVEAMAAANLTAGCGGGKFCPDAPLTRGQLAVFLSHGLGLFTWKPGM